MTCDCRCRREIPVSFAARVVAMAIVASATPVVWAESILAATDLQQSCLEYERAPSGSAGRFCAAYVRGYLDGVSAVDSRVRSDRAVAVGATGEPTATAGPSYCIARSIPIDRLIAQVLSYAGERPPDAKMTAGQLVDAAFRRFYACPRLRAAIAVDGNAAPGRRRASGQITSRTKGAPPPPQARDPAVRSPSAASD